MKEIINPPDNQLSLTQREDLLKYFPCFTNLTATDLQQLAALCLEKRFEPKDQIVSENDLVDSIYIIIEGEAEVTKSLPKRKKITQIPLAILREGEGIGMNDTGFYSSTGKRTATVTAITSMLSLQLLLKDLYQFLKDRHLESKMYDASSQMMKMKFIKQSLPFAKISHERLLWLADRVEEQHLSAGAILFNQGDLGEHCYLIRSGQVDLTMRDEEGHERKLTSLKPPALFGEATLITHTPRNATARAAVDSDLFILSHAYLSELIESESGVANMFMTLMVDRARPTRNLAVTMHQRTAADGQALTILKNTDNSSYFKLSAEGLFIWQQLDGKKTLQDITLDLAEQFDVFSPDTVAALISKLAKSGFIENINVDQSGSNNQHSWLNKSIIKLRSVCDRRFALGDADPWLTKTYERYIRYFYTRPGQIILVLLAIAGVLAFIDNTSQILAFFSRHHASLLLLLTLLPLSLIAVVLHELGHAYTVKAYGREVHYMGVGWCWVSPIAFTDTSDMWLTVRKPRMMVNLAGIYVDIIVAGLSSICIFFTSNHYVQGVLWLFALYTYIGAFRMLSPLQDLDGYYVLTDWVEKSRLRQSAVIWLVKQFPKAIRNPKLFREHRAEVTYWLACILFLILVTVMTLVLQFFVLTVLGMQSSNPYIALALPFIVAIISSLGILIQIKNQAEND